MFKNLSKQEEHVWNQYIFYFIDCFTASTSCVSDLQMKINLNSYNYLHQYIHNDIALEDSTMLFYQITCKLCNKF